MMFKLKRISIIG